MTSTNSNSQNTNTKTEQTSKAKMPSKKLTVDMFVDNPNEYDIKYFNYLNSLTKKELIKDLYVSNGWVPEWDTKEWCERNPELLSKPKKTTKKTNPNTIPKPACKHIHKAMELYPNIKSQDLKDKFDLINNTIFGIQLFKNPKTNEVIMFADFQTLHITENKKSYTHKHNLSIVEELCKTATIKNIDSISNQKGYGEYWKTFINNCKNKKFNFNTKPFSKLHMDSFNDILEEEEEHNNKSTYIEEFLNRYRLDNGNYKIPYLFCGSEITIINDSMFRNEGLYSAAHFNKYNNYTGKITLNKKDEKVSNYNVYQKFRNYKIIHGENTNEEEDIQSNSSNDTNTNDLDNNSEYDSPIPSDNEEEDNIDNALIESSEEYIENEDTANAIQQSIIDNNEEVISDNEFDNIIKDTNKIRNTNEEWKLYLWYNKKQKIKYCVNNFDYNIDNYGITLHTEEDNDNLYNYDMNKMIVKLELNDNQNIKFSSKSNPISRGDFRMYSRNFLNTKDNKWYKLSIKEKN